MNITSIKRVGPIFLILLLTACHDGNSAASNDDDDSAPSGNSNWDEMTWDQDNWA